jgi:hypothetical protein
VATGPRVCQPQMVRMLAFKLGLPMFLRAGSAPGRAVHILRRGISFRRVCGSYRQLPAGLALSFCISTPLQSNWSGSWGGWAQQALRARR